MFLSVNLINEINNICIFSDSVFLQTRRFLRKQQLLLTPCQQQMVARMQYLSPNMPGTSLNIVFGFRFLVSCCCLFVLFFVIDVFSDLV